jgi:hypothetical protein
MNLLHHRLITHKSPPPSLMRKHHESMKTKKLKWTQCSTHSFSNIWKESGWIICSFHLIDIYHSLILTLEDYASNSLLKHSSFQWTNLYNIWHFPLEIYCLKLENIKLINSYVCLTQNSYHKVIIYLFI